MPITIKHQPVAGVFGAAVATGANANEERRRREQAALLAQNQRQQFMGQMAAFNNLADLQRLGMEQTWRGGQNALDRGARSAEGEAGRVLEREQDRSAYIQQEVNSGRAFYTPDQQARYNELSSELAWINENPGISDADKAYAQQTILPQLDQIRMNPQVNLQQPMSLDDRLRGSVQNYDDVSDLPWVLDPKTGQPEVDQTASHCSTGQGRTADETGSGCT